MRIYIEIPISSEVKNFVALGPLTNSILSNVHACS